MMAFGGRVGRHTTLGVGTDRDVGDAVGVGVGDKGGEGKRVPTAVTVGVGVAVGRGGGEKVGEIWGGRIATVGVAVGSDATAVGDGEKVGVGVREGVGVNVGVHVAVAAGMDVGVCVGVAVAVGVGGTQISWNERRGGGSPWPGSPGPQDQPSTSPS